MESTQVGWALRVPLFCFKLATPGWHLSIYTGWACVRALGVLCKPPIQIPSRRVEARLRLGEATRHQHASPGRGRRRRREGQRLSEGGVRDHRRRTHVGGRPWRCSASCWTCATSPLPCATQLASMNEGIHNRWLLRYTYFVNLMTMSVNRSHNGEVFCCDSQFKWCWSCSNWWMFRPEHPELVSQIYAWCVSSFSNDSDMSVLSVLCSFLWPMWNSFQAWPGTCLLLIM